MPRVRVYEADSVAPASTTDARFRAADDGGVGFAIGEGAAALGRAGTDYAEAQAEINFKFDDTESRKATQRYQSGAAKLLAEFQLEQGANAYGKREATDAALKELRETTVAGLTNDRMRRMTNDRIAGMYDADTVRISEHTTRQLLVEEENTLKSQVVLSGEAAAANWDNPALLGKHRDTMLAAVEDLGALKGWSDDTLKLETANAVSAMHKDVVNRNLADGDIDAADAYLEANADELNATDEIALRSAMKEPLLKRVAQTDFKRAIASIPVPEGTSTAAPAPTGTSLEVMYEVTAQSESRNRERDAKGNLITSPAGAQGKMQVMPTTNTDPGFGVKAAKDSSDAERTRVGRDYLAAMLKRYGGDPAKAWAAYNWGPGNLDAAMDKYGDDWLKNAPAETRDYVNKNMAAIGGAGAQQSPRTWDKNAVYAQIDGLADREKWQPERRERAKEWADREIGRDEQLKARDENQAEREASEWVLKNPNFTDVSQMPANIRDRLPPSTLMQYLDAAKRNAAPKEVQANGQTALDLTLMSIYDPDGFKGVSLGTYVGSITRAELESLASKQATMRTEKPKDNQLRSGITSAITWGEKYSGIEKLDDGQRVAIYGLMESYAMQMSDGGKKPLSENDYQAIFKRATREVPTTKSTLGFTRQSSKPIYDLDTSNIPEATRDKIVAAYKKTFGREPNDDQIADYWRRHYAK